MIGNTYLVPGPEGQEVAGVLEMAVANPNEANALGVYRMADGQHIIATCPLSPAEVAAYKRHPDTFFGTYKPERHVKDPLDLFDFFYDVYSMTSREGLLDLMKDHPDTQLLSALPQEELAILYCERLAEAVARHGSRGGSGIRAQDAPSVTSHGGSASEATKVSAND